MKTYDFKQNLDEPYFYKLIKDGKMVFLVLYMDGILLIRNSIEVMSNVK